MRSVSYHYPDGRSALDELSIEIGTGERVAVLGPNGAGKTTMALHLIGVLPLQAGSISIDGIAVTDERLAEVRRRVGMVFQNPDDQLFMPVVEDDVAFGPANLGLDRSQRSQRVTEALDEVGAGSLRERTSHHLSTGEKRRVALATVLAMRPATLVLDEPTSGLDPAGRRELIELLRGLSQTQLVISHDLPFALELCPRSVIVSDGRVVADGPTPQLLADARLLARHRLELPYGLDPGALR